MEVNNNNSTNNNTTNSNNQKTIERVVSMRALKMGNSFPCQTCVVGFLTGICLTSLFLAALTSSFRGVSLSELFAAGLSSASGLSSISKFDAFTDGGCNTKPKAAKMMISQINPLKVNDRVNTLFSVWTALLNESSTGEQLFVEMERSNLPRAPHVENCKLKDQMNRVLDQRSVTGNFPPCTTWKGLLSNYPLTEKDKQLGYSKHPSAPEGAYPPWITGSDEDNYPSTRKVQRDIWSHQHPVNCSDPSLKFLVADWERIPGFGIGAQIAGMIGILGIAIDQNRILVTNYYNRADHDGCKGSARSSLSCYFFPETSQECRDRAFELMKSKEAWDKGIITQKDNYTMKEIWLGPAPRVWGDPWSYLQPTTEVNGTLVGYHRKMDRRWWRAQAVRYLMRFQTEYTCGLLNNARHAAFGWEAAEMVASSIELLEDGRSSSGIEEYVWSNHKPWMPLPLLSVHVRMGDKACEMKVVEFEEYMRLANRIRKRFPHLKTIWLSTEMQEVIDKTRSYPHWRFYYSKVKRQVGNKTMAVYEASLGREISTNYPLVNFLMATEADFFIGALGSTWCYLIDGMRNAGGKVMAGYLSVNKDRFW